MIKLTIIRLEKFRPLAFTAVLISLLIACQKDTDTPVEYEYLVDYKVNKVYSVDILKTMMLIQSAIYPEISDIADQIDYGVQVFQVTYKTHYRDSVIEASGLVCVPTSQADFPVISFQNGTNTSHDNAPSVNPSNQNYMLMEAMASNGYVVLITDYIGFGSSSEIVHPYYHRTSSDNAVIDLINAFNEMDEYDLFQANSNNTLYLMGYSQGGWATLSALDAIENRQALDMDIGGVSCGAGAYSLIPMSEYVLGLETFPGPLYLPYYLYAHQFYGIISTPLSAFFKDPYPMIIPSLFDGSLDNDEVNAELTTQIADLLTDNMRNNFTTDQAFGELRMALEASSVAGWSTNVPLRFYHGTADEHVPPQQSLLVYNEFVDAGSSTDMVQHITKEGLNHGTCLIPWGFETIDWFNTLESNNQ